MAALPAQAEAWRNAVLEDFQPDHPVTGVDQLRFVVMVVMVMVECQLLFAPDTP